MRYFQIIGFVNKRLFIGLIKIEKILKYGITILLVIALVYTIFTELAGYKVLITDALLVGSCLGIWGTDYYKQVKNIEFKKK